jgi:hypothetical protein
MPKTESEKKIGRGISLKGSTWELVNRVCRIMDRPVPWVFERAIRELAQRMGIEEGMRDESEG